MDLRRRGFTLTEMVVVIGIILILMSFAIVGMTYVARSAKTQATRNTLRTCQSLLADYEHDAGSGQLWENTPLNLTGTYVAGNPPPLGTKPNTAGWSTGAYSIDATRWGFVGLPQPALPSPTNRDNCISDNLTNYMYYLWQIPSVRKEIEQMPGKSTIPNLLSTSVAFSLPTTTSSPAVNLAAYTPPILIADAWGNPIGFVPCALDTASPNKFDGGLANVTVNTTSTANAISTTITSLDYRPFFVSAGPDTNFANGDDNLYSNQP